jgi:hypothetical protein
MRQAKSIGPHREARNSLQTNEMQCPDRTLHIIERLSLQSTIELRCRG